MIRTIIKRLKCKHNFVLKNQYEYLNYDYSKVYVDEYFCVKCGKHKKIKRW